MGNISLDEEMIAHIESIHKMSRQEIRDLWDETIGFDENTPASTDHRKLELLCFIYSVKNKTGPTEEIKNKIKFQLQCLEMEKKAAEYEQINMAA